jgi:hypothetical protein
MYVDGTSCQVILSSMKQPDIALLSIYLFFSNGPFDFPGGYA